MHGHRRRGKGGVAGGKGELGGQMQRLGESCSGCGEGVERVKGLWSCERLTTSLWNILSMMNICTPMFGSEGETEIEEMKALPWKYELTPNSR